MNNRGNIPSVVQKRPENINFIYVYKNSRESQYMYVMSKKIISMVGKDEDLISQDYFLLLTVFCLIYNFWAIRIAVCLV